MKRPRPYTEVGADRGRQGKARESVPRADRPGSQARRRPAGKVSLRATRRDGAAPHRSQEGVGLDGRRLERPLRSHLRPRGHRLRHLAAARAHHRDRARLPHEPQVGARAERGAGSARLFERPSSPGSTTRTSSAPAMLRCASTAPCANCPAVVRARPSPGSSPGSPSSSATRPSRTPGCTCRRKDSRRRGRRRRRGTRAGCRPR